MDDAMRWLIFTIFILIAMFCASCQHPRSQSQSHAANSVEDSEMVNLSMSQFEGVLYFFRTSRGSLRKTPKWNRSAEFPPLSPRRAQEAAWNRVRQLRPDVRSWYRESISLHPFGNSLYDFNTDEWFYVVQFSRADVPVTGVPFYLDVPVLMDGRALTASTGPFR